MSRWTADLRSCRRELLIVMPREDNLVAGRAGAANKNKNKKPSAKTLKAYEYAAAAAEKKAVAAEAATAATRSGGLRRIVDFFRPPPDGLVWWSVAESAACGLDGERERRAGSTSPNPHGG